MAQRPGADRMGQKSAASFAPKAPSDRKDDMSSILTNNGAMVALQTMKSISANMARTQSEISTGKTVATAKDNATVWITLALDE